MRLLQREVMCEVSQPKPCAVALVLALQNSSTSDQNDHVSPLRDRVDQWIHVGRATARDLMLNAKSRTLTASRRGRRIAIIGIIVVALTVLVGIPVGLMWTYYPSRGLDAS